MVSTENGRKRPGSDNQGFSSLDNGEQKNGSLNTSVGSSVLSSHPADGAIVLGEKTLRGNRSFPIIIGNVVVVNKDLTGFPLRLENLENGKAF